MNVLIRQMYRLKYYVTGDVNNPGNARKVSNVNLDVLHCCIKNDYFQFFFLLLTSTRHCVKLLMVLYGIVPETYFTSVPESNLQYYLTFRVITSGNACTQYAKSHDTVSVLAESSTHSAGRQYR